MTGTHVSRKHPRAESIRIRERLTRHIETGVVALAGLIAHGRGEAFDYILGEKTTPSARRAIASPAASLLLAEQPVLAVNGNVAALCAKEFVKLAKASNAKLEVNLFHRLPGREAAIEKLLRDAGAEEVLGVGDAASARIDEVNSDRRRALRRMGKTVIAVDLNPLSRTAQLASITIVDNIVRAMPLLVSEVERLRVRRKEELGTVVSEFSNEDALSDAMRLMRDRLDALSKEGVYIDLWS